MQKEPARPGEAACLAGRRTVVDPVDLEAREAPRGVCRTRVPLGLERPGRVLGEERRLQREPEREREAAGSGLEPLRIRCGREPAFRVAYRLPARSPAAGVAKEAGQAGVLDVT